MPWVEVHCSDTPWAEGRPSTASGGVETAGLKDARDLGQFLRACPRGLRAISARPDARDLGQFLRAGNLGRFLRALMPGT